MPIPNIDVSLYPGLRSSANPRVSTRPGFVDGTRPGGGEPSVATLIFSENFSAQPDWTSTLFSTDNTQEARRGDTLPQNWDMIYQGTAWSPETGHPEKHASLEILDTNDEKALSGGKSAVFWRESFSNGTSYYWASDAQLIKVLPADYEELYVEFYVRFSENWYQRNNEDSWESKFFRMGSWSRVGNPYNGFGGEIGPRLFFDYRADEFGVRNKLSFYAGPWGSTNKVSGGIDGSRNFTTHTAGMGVGGSDPQIPDQINGGFLINGPTKASHEMVYGESSHWTKMAFYVRMNSAPGVPDGELKQWINDVRMNTQTDIPWVQSTPENNMVGWNYIAIGGNDFFRPFPDEEQFEDWWSLDNLSVYNGIPEGVE